MQVYFQDLPNSVERSGVSCNYIRTGPDARIRITLISPVAVEKLGFSEKSRKSGDKKCLADWGKSLVELPDAKRFLRIREERVLQQPLLLSPPTSK
jgi:hypothetical protein